MYDSENEISGIVYGSIGNLVIFTIVNFDPYGIFITIEDVYHLNEEYLENPALVLEEADRMLNKYAMGYVDIGYIGKTGLEYNMIGKVGYIDYCCSNVNTMSLAWVKYPQIALKFYWTGELIHVLKLQT